MLIPNSGISVSKMPAPDPPSACSSLLDHTESGENCKLPGQQRRGTEELQSDHRGPRGMETSCWSESHG